MKKAVCLVLTVVFIGSQMIGCATNEDMSGTAKGAGIGAATGGLLGALAGRNARGALIGVLAGAVVGAVAGHYYDQQTATRADAQKKYGAQIAADRLEIEGSTLAPQDITAGATVDSAVEYTALSAQPSVPVKVTETRTLVGPKDTMELAKRDVTRQQGTHTSTMKFTVPKDLPRGNYTLVTSVSDGKQTKTVRNPLRVV